jgi:peptidoglycan hydrolase-like protein with peptidoglycan-binding domain
MTAPPPPEGPDKRAAYLQKLLRMSGYEFGPVDGIVGPKTEAAIGRFQAAAGLKVTNRFDDATVARLRAMWERKAA